MYLRGLKDSLSMQLVGKDFHVRFFRQKRQQIYQWKEKEKEKLELKDIAVHVTALIILVLVIIQVVSC